MTADRIAENLHAIQQRIAAAAREAGRDPDAVRLIAVTKEVDAGAIRVLYDLGVRHFAENRVPVAREKRAALSDGDIVWHMIGNIQRRKVPEVLEVFDRIDAVDRLELAASLQQRCEALGRERLPVLLEVNVSGEVNKHGLAPAAVGESVAALRAMDRLHLEGLMTMAPFDAPESVLQGVFRTLKELADAQHLPVISMGMTDDFETAIREGATEVRIGRALFEGAE
jgi:pyridoxal phosphate enzyme (YggS family)